MTTILKAYSVAEAIAQVDACDFQCDAGSIADNAGWQWIKAATKVGPEFWPGQTVWFEIEAEAAGKKLTQWVSFFIVGCSMNADTERRFWCYDLSYDPPAPWHTGTIHFKNVSGSRLRLEKP